jgi:hypothetical protein
MTIRSIGPIVGAILSLAVHLSAAEVVFDVNGFEDAPEGRPPTGWCAFHPGAEPSVFVVPGGANGSRQSLRGERSESGGWTALSREFDSPQQRVMIDDLIVTGGGDLPAPHRVEPSLRTRTLWTGPPIPDDPEEIPFVPGVQHRTVHRATADGYKFLHGAAIVHHKGVFYANWANSPTNENGPHETLQGRRSTDGGQTWSELEVIGPGFDGEERHSHGVLFVHQDRLWTIGSRFGVGTAGRRFTGLKAEAFVLNERTDQWESRGVVMENCWPYDEPVRMGNGNWITGGQDKDGLPVVAISRGEDLTKWDSVLIPFDPRLQPGFAETTVWAEGQRVMAVIRGGGGVAWLSTSDDNGRSWSKATPSNLPMPRAKAYLGRLSTGQLYLLSNLKNRDTLVISVGKPGEQTLSQMWRIRHGRSGPPRFPGRAKGKQWSYPYGYEHDGKLFVVYSIGKEDCGLSVLPMQSLRPEPTRSHDESPYSTFQNRSYRRQTVAKLKKEPRSGERGYRSITF